MVDETQESRVTAGKNTRPDMPLPPLPTETRQTGGVSGRMDMPLPPLPSSTSPPVPQRTSGSSTSSRDQLSNSYPPLPPRNPRANGGSSSPVPPPHQTAPPDPPRGAPAPPAPTPTPASRAQCREDSIMDLVTLGYSRSDVVRALSIAKNDFGIAKGILTEFGGRV